MEAILTKIFKRPPLPCFSDKPPALPWTKVGTYSYAEITKLDEKQLKECRKGSSFWIFRQAKKILGQRGTLIFTLSDALNSRINRYVTEGGNFFTEGESQMILRQANLTFNYRIKQ